MAEFEITIANKDSAIVTAVKNAIADAYVGGPANKVFEKVEISDSVAQADEANCTASPQASVIYEGRSEHRISGLKLGCECRMTIRIGCKGESESPEARKTEIYRLINAVHNAVETSPPPDTEGFVAAAGNFHERIQWGDPAASATQPWATADLPLTVAYTITNSISH